MTLLQGGYHYIVPLHNGWGYIQRHKRPKNTSTSYKRSTSDYGWNTNRNSNDIHPASPGCRPGTYPLIEEEGEEELQYKQTSLSRHDHRKTCTCIWCWRRQVAAGKGFGAGTEEGGGGTEVGEGLGVGLD